MKKKDDNYIYASQKECEYYFDIIDMRINLFKEIINNKNIRINNIYYERMNNALIILRHRLRTNFQDLYDKNFLGKKIRKSVKSHSFDISDKLNSFPLSSNKCCICGESRVINLAHIIPRAYKGPDEYWNLLVLCANHHYLFDQAQLTQHEWNKINWDSIDPKAREYALTIRLENHKIYWEAHE